MLKDASRRKFENEMLTAEMPADTLPRSATETSRRHQRVVTCTGNQTALEGRGAGKELVHLQCDDTNEHIIERYRH
jgi:hypothetical protein